jgi:hypothetical protein
VLVTHQTQWLHACGRVLVVRRGRVIADGPWAALRDDPDLVELSQQRGGEATLADEDVDALDVATGAANGGGPGDDTAAAASPSRECAARQSKDADGADAATGTGGGEQGNGAVRRTDHDADTAPAPPDGKPRTGADGAHSATEKPPGDTGAASGHKLTREEHRELGSVSRGVYGRYLRAVGVEAVAAVGLALAGGQSAWILSEWWLSQWAQQDKAGQGDTKWLAMYGGLVAGARSCSFGEVSERAAATRHVGASRRDPRQRILTRSLFGSPAHACPSSSSAAMLRSRDF